jgi:hypothetical protein
MTQYYRPDVIQVQTQRRSMRGMRGLGGTFDAFAVPTEITGHDAMSGTAVGPADVLLVYPADANGVPGGMSRAYAKHPIAWSLGFFATGWAGGYLTWLFLGRKKRKY